MTQATNDESPRYFQMPRKDAGIVKQHMKAWTELGDTVFAINAKDERITIKLTDGEKAKEIPAPSLPESPEELTQDEYISCLESAIVAFLSIQNTDALDISLADLEKYSGRNLTTEYDPESQTLRLTLES